MTTKQNELSEKMVAALNSGMSAREAFAVVLPAVDFDAFVSDLYESLKAKAN